MGRIKDAWPSLLAGPDFQSGDVLADIPNVFYALDLRPGPSFTFVSENVQVRFGVAARDLIADARLWIGNADAHGDSPPWWVDVEQRRRDHEVVEYRIRRDNADHLWVHDEFRVLRDPAGTAVKVTGSWINVSKRKVAEIALRESEQQLRQALDERERLSRDLHDGIVQSLYAIGLGLEESRRVLPEDRLAADEIVGQAIRDLNEVIREVRQHIVWTGPQGLTPQQLRADLRALSKTAKGANRLRFRLDLDARAVASLSVEAVHNVLNIVREAMSNSLRHSRGHSGLVSLRRHAPGVRLIISDDGIGFDPSRRTTSGLGLKNMAVRASELGAVLDLRSSPGRGTVITIDLPVSHG